MRVALLLLIAIAIACSSKSTTPSRVASGGIKPPPVDTDRFPHAKHTGEIKNSQGKALGCADCHDAASVLAGKVSRPGTNHHAPCDDCHKDEFAKPPGKLCKNCHTSVDSFTKGNSPLENYPERGATRALASSFSHRQHLDKAEMEDATGSHVACGDCHVRDAKSRDPQVPGHAQCAPCHEQQPKVKAKLAMTKCAGCHPQRNLDLVRGRRFITGDLKFSHATHEVDKAGAAVPCAVCHAGVADSDTRDDMRRPPMVQCAQCHEDSSRSPDRVRMANCGVCHGAITGDAPPNHMVTGGGEAAGRPSDHTLYFRKHHGEQAAKPDSTCRFCHTELQGAREDSCFQCHLTMKPRDHSLMWRTDHGKEAQADGQRCAQCHTPETCVACHSVPPRSHTPLGDFRLGGHAELARFGLSSCLTCHTYEDTCSKCHRGTR